MEIFYARKKLREMNQKVFENYLTPKGRYFPKTGLKNWTDMFKAWSLYWLLFSFIITTKNFDFLYIKIMGNLCFKESDIKLDKFQDEGLDPSTTV